MHASPTVGRILLVDDNADLLESMVMVLEEFGHAVASARSGHEALELLRRGERFDVMLCDFVMPDMTGWQVAAEAQAQAPALKVYLLTGGVELAEAVKPQHASVAGVFAKPIDIESLQALLARAIAG